MVGADTVPVTSTPSDTDCSVRSSSIGAPASMRMRSKPIRDGEGTVSATVIIEPGRRPPNREMSMTSGFEAAMPLILLWCGWAPIGSILDHRDFYSPARCGR